MYIYIYMCVYMYVLHMYIRPSLHRALNTEYYTGIITSNFLLNYLNFSDTCKHIYDMSI